MTTSLYNRRAGIRVELSAPSGFLLHVGVRYSQSNGLVTRDFNFSQHHHVKWGLRWLAAKLIGTEDWELDVAGDAMLPRMPSGPNAEAFFTNRRGNALLLRRVRLHSDSVSSFRIDWTEGRSRTTIRIPVVASTVEQAEDIINYALRAGFEHIVFASQMVGERASVHPRLIRPDLFNTVSHSNQFSGVVNDTTILQWLMNDLEEREIIEGCAAMIPRAGTLVDVLGGIDPEIEQRNLEPERTIPTVKPKASDYWKRRIR